MRLPFQEIWDATVLVPDFFPKYRVDLYLGDYCFQALSQEMLQQLQQPSSCDSDLLPVLFSEREIFWQPDMQPSLNAWCTRFNIFNDFLHHYTEALKNQDTSVDYLYAAILHDLKTKATYTQNMLKNSVQATPQVQYRFIARFRVATYPHILFFLRQPHVPLIAARYAENRLDLMIRTLLLKNKIPLRVLVEPRWQLQVHTPSTAPLEKNKKTKGEEKR